MLASTLRLRRLRVEVRLGVSEGERARPQTVEVDLHLLFAQVPAAAASDEIAETCCYGALAEQIGQAARRKHYHLIEHLASEMLKELRSGLKPGDLAWIEVTKLKPPVPGLEGGACFGLGDASLRPAPGLS